MEAKKKSRQVCYQEDLNFTGFHGSSLTRRRGAIFDTLPIINDAELRPVSPGSKYIDVILDVAEIDEIEHRCRFKDNETLGDVLSAVTEDCNLDVSQCRVVLLSQPNELPILSNQASKFAFQSILVTSTPKKKLSLTFQESPTEMSSVTQCISYFSRYGLKSLNDTTSDDEHSPLPDIPYMCYHCWEDLLDRETIEGLTDKEEEQQIAIWELLYTERSHLTQLAVVINTFMRCLEYIQSIDLLTEVNYHNIFGLMRDIYDVHWQFWTTALLPCIQQAASVNKPLDVDDLISNFPQFNEMFEVYERHCIFERQNLQALDEAMKSADFATYIKWCELRPECKRLRLKDYLAKPMQRLTKYPLLLMAILKKTTNQQTRVKLQEIISMVDEFVSKVNVALQYQDEAEKVKNVAQRLTPTSIFHHIPSGWEKYLQPYMKLDLLAPMPGINLYQPRALVMEGPLRYRDDTVKMDVEVFLFTDMLLITRASKKSLGKLDIVKAPYKIDSLIVKQGKDTGVVDLVTLNEFHFVSSMFSFKAATPKLASTWIKGIQKAQQFYYQLRCSHESNTFQKRFGTCNNYSYGSQQSLSPSSSILGSTVDILDSCNSLSPSGSMPELTVSCPSIHSSLPSVSMSELTSGRPLCTSQHSLSPSGSLSELTNGHPHISRHNSSPNAGSPIELLRTFNSQYSSRYHYIQPPSISPPIITCTITQDVCTQTEPEIIDQLSNNSNFNLHANVRKLTSCIEQTTNSKPLPQNSQSLNKKSRFQSKE